MLNLAKGLLGRKGPEIKKTTPKIKIESVSNPLVKEHKLSMLSKPNRITAMLPDWELSDSELLKVGLQKENGKWFVPNRKYFPDPLYFPLFLVHSSCSRALAGSLRGLLLRLGTSVMRKTFFHKFLDIFVVAF